MTRRGAMDFHRPHHKLRKAIEDSGLSASVLARAIGVTPPTISRFVHKERSVSLEIADKLFVVLGLDLVKGEPPQDLSEHEKPLGRPPRLNPSDSDPTIFNNGL